MELNALKEAVVHALEEAKATDINIIDVREQTTITDLMIVCTGRSSRHVNGVSGSLVTAMKKLKLDYIKTEGEQEGEWAIVDLADIVVHIMLPTAREFYQLEDLWEPIKLQRSKHQES